jgi:hypothetical protein
MKCTDSIMNSKLFLSANLCHCITADQSRSINFPVRWFCFRGFIFMINLGSKWLYQPKSSHSDINDNQCTNIQNYSTVRYYQPTIPASSYHKFWWKRVPHCLIASKLINESEKQTYLLLKITVISLYFLFHDCSVYYRKISLTLGERYELQ